MANIVIKKNFVDGDKLFAQQLNNNFETIEKGINDGNKIVWQDGTEVKFKRHVTNDIDSLPILDGSIIYDTEKGRHYIDYKGQRVQVGSAGKEVLVQEEQPTEEDNKIWIEYGVVNTMGTEVVNSLDGNETNMAPSVNVINKINSYSTEEQRIGTWIDGKPLYRAVLTVDTPNPGGNVNIFYYNPNIKEICAISGIVYRKDKIIALPIGARPNTEWHTYFDDNYANYHEEGYFLSLVHMGSLWTEKDFGGMHVIVEYTKTTDSEVI